MSQSQSVDEAIARLASNQQLLSKQITQVVSSQNIKQLTAAINNSIQNLQQQIDTLNPAQQISQAIAAMARGFITTLKFSQFSAAVDNELSNIRSDASSFGSSVSALDARLNLIETGTSRQFRRSFLFMGV